MTYSSIQHSYWMITLRFVNGMPVVTSMYWWMNFRILTWLSMSYYEDYPHTIIISMPLEMPISPSTAGGGQITVMFYASNRIIQMFRSFYWSRITAPPNISWM